MKTPVPAPCSPRLVTLVSWLPPEQEVIKSTPVYAQSVTKLMIPSTKKVNFVLSRGPKAVKSPGLYILINELS